MPKSTRQRKAEKRNARARTRARQNRHSSAHQDTPFKDIPTYISGFLSDSHNLITNLLHLSKLIDAALATVEKMYQKSGSAEDEKKLHIFQGYKDTLEKAKPHIAELYRGIGAIEDAQTNADKMAAIFETFSVFSEAGEIFQDIMERFNEDNAIITGVQPDGTTVTAAETVEPVKDEPTEFEDVADVVDTSATEPQPVGQTESEVSESTEVASTIDEAEIAPVETKTPTDSSGSSSSSN